MEVFCRIRLILYVKNIGSLCSNLSEATDLAFAAFAPPPLTRGFAENNQSWCSTGFRIQDLEVNLCTEQQTCVLQ